MSAAKGGTGIKNTPFKGSNGPVVPTSSGSPDLNFEGEAKLTNPEYNLDGSSQRFVLILGDGELEPILNELE